MGGDDTTRSRGGGREGGLAARSPEPTRCGAVRGSPLLPLLTTDAGTAFGRKAAVRHRAGSGGRERAAGRGGQGGAGGGAGEGGGGGEREEEEAAGGGRPRGVADVALSPDPPSRFGPRAAAERRGRSWELEGARKAPPKGSATPGPELAACRPLSRGPPRIPAAGRLVGSPPGLAERRSRPRKVVGPVIELSNGCSCRPKMAGQGGERGGGVGWGGDKHETNTAKRRARRAERAARPSAEGKELRARCPGAARGRAGPYQPVARAAPRSAPR